jgi:predicted phage baseplate assembly protein
MSLAPLVLDDLDWAQLTDAARLRLPALSGGRWTLHAPVDPGVTLVELFAWLLDQRVYWMDRVEEPLFRATVELLGEAVRPLRAARTVLALARGGPLTRVSTGTTLEIARAQAGPVFATAEGIELLDVRRMGLAVAGSGDGAAVDRENDLREERGVTLFAADGNAGEARIVLYLPAPPTSAARPVSIFLDVQAAPGVLPEWSPDATAVPPPAEISWWYSRGPALAPRRFPDAGVRDGTGGLRRAGIVRLPIPADWAAEGPAAGGLLPFAILARTDASTFTYPVSVRKIVPNAAIATHQRVVRETRRLTEWLPLPGLSISLGENASPPIPEEVRVRIRETDGHWHRWHPVPDFARSGPADRVFRVDRARRRIEFGDGLTGRIPRPDASVAPGQPNVKLAVLVGGGPEGNVAASLSWTGDVAADVRGTGLAEATGGLEAETVDEARVRISGLLERVERAVTAEDHVTLAEGTPGVAIARAHAAVGFHPGFPCRVVPGAITVFVVPWAPRGQAVTPEARVAAPMPDPGALSAVRKHLGAARIVGTEVFVCPPRYRTVRLALRVLGDPADPQSARLRIDAALRRFLDPLEGGDDLAGWPFGDPLRPSALMREAVPAVEDAEIDSVAIGLDGAAPSEDCREVAIGPHDLPVLADVAVLFEPDRRARPGGLR